MCAECRSLCRSHKLLFCEIIHLSFFSLLLPGWCPFLWGENIPEFSEQAGTRTPTLFLLKLSFLLLPRCHRATPPCFEVTLCIYFFPKPVLHELKISISCQVFQMTESHLSQFHVQGKKKMRMCPISKPESLGHFKILNTNTLFLDLNVSHLFCMSKNQYISDKSNGNPSCLERRVFCVSTSACKELTS